MSGRETPTNMRYVYDADGEEVRRAEHERLRTRKRVFDNSPIRSLQVDDDVSPFRLMDDKENSSGNLPSPIGGLFLSSTKEFLGEDEDMPEEIAALVAFGGENDFMMGLLETPKATKKGKPKRRIRAQPLPK